MKMKLIIPKPHVKPQHVKHTASFGILFGTLLETLHIAYPAGLIVLGAAGIIAVYEPYFVHEVKEVFLETDA